MFDYQEIFAKWETYPAVRIYYHAYDESGWARQLDDSHVCLANVPCSGGLMYRDIVTLERHEPDLPRLAQVVQRYYRWQWSVAYLEEDASTDPDAVQAAYTALRLACEAVGCAVEGAYVGLAIVNAPADVDLRAFLEPLGLVGEALRLYQPTAPTRTEPGA
jgi:hypothetical protein